VDLHHAWDILQLKSLVGGGSAFTSLLRGVARQVDTRIILINPLSSADEANARLDRLRRIVGNLYIQSNVGFPARRCEALVLREE
jgi:hypothetical protein